jgi:hypothetical protein
MTGRQRDEDQEHLREVIAEPHPAALWGDGSTLREKPMRYFAIVLPLLAVGCADNYGGGYAYDNAGPYPARYASGYGYGDGYYGSPSGYYGGENCGTPDEPKACPPPPRTSLPYYPGDRY